MARFAFISDLLYNLNMEKRPCHVGYRVWYVPMYSKDDIISYDAYFNKRYVYLLHDIFTPPKRFKGEEHIIQLLSKREAKQYEAAYYAIFGEKK